MLLLLDNCEHVLDAVAELVDDLLVDGTELAVLATSRVPLDVDGELVVPLDPLPLPAEGADPRTAPAGELFLERLGAADDPDDATLERVARICRAVDGVPLAIELAAARARAYSLDEIAAQVTEDASTLGRIGRGPAGHHRTVRFAVEQSYRTLSAEEAALHRAVSVVPGPFTAAWPPRSCGGRSPRCARCSPASCTARCWSRWVRPVRAARPGSRSWRPSAGTPPTAATGPEAER